MKEYNGTINIKSEEVHKKKKKEEKEDCSHYLRLIVHKEGDIKDNVKNRIAVCWLE